MLYTLDRISDHSLIYAFRKINCIRENLGFQNTTEIRNMKRFSEERFLLDLSKQPWDHVYFYADNPDSMREIWRKLFTDVLDKHAPIQKKKIKSKKVSWITSEIKKLIISRDKLKRKAIITKLKIDWDNYKQARNETNSKIRQPKKDYYCNKISAEKQDPKAAWKTINTLIGKHIKPTKVNELAVNNTKLTGPDEISEGFNDFFLKIGPNLAKKIEKTEYQFKDYIKHTNSKFSAFKPVTINQMCSLLLQLSGSKATGLDKTSSKVLKIAAPVISDSLTYIFNQAVTLCTFPNGWKIARVIPLFKNGQRNLPGNYRPISILPALSKVMERILYTQLYEYLSVNNLLSEHQFGFRKYHSTASALLDCTNDWYINMDQKLFNLTVFIDLKKAFDTVNHEILLEKLLLLGTTGSAFQLLESYLSDRSQKCEVNGFISKEKKIT